MSNDTQEADPQVHAVILELLMLTDEQRMRVFNRFCKYCGCDDPHCMCWNDE